ncbi:hypothetical protein HYT02_04210 [Candidatus Gottesmanbacteria bacterium]|nr:hypothetical protein [Candidatus Gottesmanbacteria bacterium]
MDILQEQARVTPKGANLQFAVAPEVSNIVEQPIPKWKQVIDGTRDHLEEYLGRQIAEKASVNEGILESPLFVQNLRGERQRVINEITAAKSGLAQIQQFETYNLISPPLQQQKQEIEKVITSIEQRIAKKQFTGMSQMELGQQLEEERKMLAQVDTEIDKVTPDVLKDENLLNKKGFWTDARRTSNQAIEELIRIAKEEAAKPATEPVEITQNPENNEPIVKPAQSTTYEINTLNVPIEDKAKVLKGVLEREGFQAVAEVNPTIEELAQLTLENAKAITEIGDSYPNPTKDEIIIEEAIAGGLQTALTGVPIEEFLSLNPEQKRRRLGRSTSEIIKEKGSKFVEKLRGVSGKRLRQAAVGVAAAVITGALTVGSGGSADIAPKVVAQTEQISPQPFVPKEISYAPSPTATIKAEPSPTPKLNEPVIPEKTPTPTMTITPSQTPTASATPENPTTTPTPSMTPHFNQPVSENVTPPLEPEVKANPVEPKDPYQEFFMKPLVIEGTLWGTLTKDLPDKIIGNNWLAPTGRTKKDIVMDMIIKFSTPDYQEGLDQNGKPRDINNIQDGETFSIYDNMSDYQMALVKMAMECVSYDDYLAKIDSKVKEELNSMMFNK